MALTTNLPALAPGNTTVELATRKGVAKQIVADLTKNTLVLMDGVRNGGHPLAKEERRLVTTSKGVTLNGGKSADLSSDITLEFDVSAALPAAFAELQEAVSSAQASGQIGDPAYLGEVNANTVIETGKYIVRTVNNADTGYNLYENNWPQYLSQYTVLEVVGYNNIIVQKITNPGAEWIRRSTDSGETWGLWTPVFTSGFAKIYISKSGDNGNTGISPDYPVATGARAIEIANAIHAGSPNTTIKLCFGAGDWGNFTIRSLPYTVAICTYDDTLPTEYSSDIPYFSTLHAYDCNVIINGLHVGMLRAEDNTCMTVSTGYKRIARVLVWNNSYLRFLSENAASNVWDMVQNSGTEHCLYIENSSTVEITGYLTIRLAEDITCYDFMSLGTGCSFLGGIHITFDYNGHTFSGAKASLYMGSMISNGQASAVNSLGFPVMCDSFFGDGYGSSAPNNVLSNGISTGNVRKSGDTVSGALSFTDGNPFYFYGSHDSLVSGHAQESFGLQRYRDKNGRQLGYSEFVLGADNSLLWQFLLFSPANSSKRSYIGCTVLADGTGYGVTRNPPTSDNTTSIATTYFVNQKLGSAASLAALATLDASDPNYVETLEIKKQKAVAQVNADAQAAIYGGFPYEIDGQDYIIGYSLFDQTNLNSDAVVAAGNPGKTMSFRCMDETGQTVWLDVPTETVLAIQKHGVLSHRDVIRKAADEKKTRIMAAQSAEEIQSIVME